MAIVKPTIGGSADVWGDVLNTALDTLDTSVSGVVNGTTMTVTPTVTSTLGTAVAGAVRYQSSTGRFWYGIRVNSVNYWAPPPGTVVLKALASVGQTVNNATLTPLTLDTIDRDLYGNWNVGQPTRFTPNVPGFYTFAGAVSFAANATGDRKLTWRLNGTVAMTAEALVLAATSGRTTFSARPYSVYLNGTTDYVDLSMYQNSGVAVATTITSVERPYITATYAGL